MSNGESGPATGPRLVVGAVIVDDLVRPRRLLAARRTRPVELAGRWEFPGGKVEAGETAEQALVREVVEELGVAVTLGAELVAADGRPWPLTTGLEMRTWWCTVAPGQPLPRPLEGHDVVRWVAFADLLELTWLTPDLPIVRRVREGPPPATA